MNGKGGKNCCTQRVLADVYFDGSLDLTVAICHWDGHFYGYIYNLLRFMQKKIKCLFFKK